MYKKNVPLLCFALLIIQASANIITRVPYLSPSFPAALSIYDAQALAYLTPPATTCGCATPSCGCATASCGCGAPTCSCGTVPCSCGATTCNCNVPTSMSLPPIVETVYAAPVATCITCGSSPCTCGLSSPLLPPLAPVVGCTKYLRQVNVQPPYL
ncbi:hypothetical protein evm_012983 [Chilo suppressalis]|nr:hypothetical protein evm_012983 [Chilo suppressalis]